jgi:hypothetical protein
MFDLVPNESPTHGFVARGGGTYTFEHNDPANVDLFNQIGAVRKIPIEALRQTVEGSTYDRRTCRHAELFGFAKCNDR